MEFLIKIYNFVTCGFLEVFLYVAVDFIAKAPLSTASDEKEKRLIWLYESVALLLISFMVYLFSHTPVFLPVVIAATIIYTQLVGRVDFRHWWLHLRMKWDEFQQHEESMEMIQELQSRQAAAAAAVVNSAGQQQQQQHFNPRPPMTFAPAEAPVFLSGAGGMPIPMRTDRLHPGDPNDVMQRRACAMVAPPVDIRRKPLHSYLQSPARPYPGFPEPRRQSPSIRSRVLSVLGLGSGEKLLPGLPNSGLNTCFLNATLQCLAATPGFLDCLLADLTRQPRCGDAEMALVTSLTDVLSSLRREPELAAGVVETRRLRQAASAVLPELVARPGAAQRQQDVAEFLTVLLQRLHDALSINLQNSARNGDAVFDGQGGVVRPASPKYTSAALNVLKFIYGDLSPSRIEELKESCRKEIEQANGLDSESYAEPIQRLTDLEWLTYKEQNNSALDDLLSGQLVEAQHCTACNKISVSIQTFNTLRVPVVEPRTAQGLVYLEDCFARFGTVEDMYGPEGLHCDVCNSAEGARRSPRGASPRGPVLTPRTPAPTIRAPGSGTPRALPNGRRLLTPHNTPLRAQTTPSSPLLNGGLRARTHAQDSAIHTTLSQSAVMSPIAADHVVNDSGYHDGGLRTSTPIHGTVRAPRLTDGQRRALLRQLPECLVVQLLRFSALRGQPYKLQRPVHVPLYQLDLAHLIADNVMKREDLTAWNASYRYDLYGLCLHLGAESTGCGHYVSYRRAPCGRWYKLDDEKVSVVNMEYELNTRTVRENAYLLFYRKSLRV